MTMQRVIDILRTERERVERAGTATPDKACDRSCADCDLVLDDKEILEAYNMAIEALEREPCEDAVSRQFMYELGATCIATRNKNDKLIALGTIEALPPVAPQPGTARRIVGKSRGGMTLWYQCEICNEPVDVQDTFCSGCGRRLVNGCEKRAEEGQ